MFDYDTATPPRKNKIASCLDSIDNYVYLNPVMADSKPKLFTNMFPHIRPMLVVSRHLSPEWLS
jgi:hypothetical protein